MVIAYHGTRPENVDSILREGFPVGTYFAYNLEDAREFGGPCVFVAKFNEEGFQGIEDGWQFHLREPLAPEAILTLLRVQASS